MKKRSRKIPASCPAELPCSGSFSDQEFRNFLELTSDMVQIFKPEGEILEVNFAWQEGLEYGDEDLPGLMFFNLIRSEDQREAKEVFLAVSRDGKPRKFRATLLSKRGTELVVEGTVSRLLSEKKSRMLFAIFHDMTLHKNYEQLKDEFIGTVSHELRTPLTVVREGTAQIRDELLGPVSKEQKALLDMVLQNTDRLNQIIEKLLDVSKLEAGRIRLHRKHCDIAEVASGVVRSFSNIAKHKNLDLLTDFIPERIDTFIDQDKIVQVLTNLINNALNFTDQGHIKVHLRVRDGFVECKVSDTGRGISKADLSNAFEKFSQFNREVGPGDRGTGLGLPICKKLVELHHGHIKIESVPKKGTTVSILLPQCTYRDFFKGAISQAMSRCAEEQSPLSIIIFNVVDFESLEKRFGIKQMERNVLRIEQIINNALRRAADITVKDSKVIMVLLPDTSKENALIVLGRLSQVLEDNLTREQKKTAVKIHSNLVCFPDEAKTLEEILDKIYA